MRVVVGRTLRSGALALLALALALVAVGIGMVEERSATASAPAVAADSRWPSSIAGRKVLDQSGRVYLIRSLSSWAMASHLSNADITSALQGAAANGFNGVTVWIGGGANYGGGWVPEYRQKATGQDFWSGRPWASPLGPAWSSLDHLVAEAQRMGIVVWMSLNGGFGDTGARADWEAVSDTDMYNAGAAVAARYRAAPNIGWHVMLDDPTSPASTAGRRVESFFHGVNDTEGAATRPVRWLEVSNGTSTNQQGWIGTSGFRATINSWYSYGSNSTEIAEAGFGEVGSLPAGDCEPPYDGSPHYGGDLGQQLRERSYATFLEGGALINYGVEDWWPFGQSGLYSEGLRWQQVPTHVHTVQQSYAWALLDQYVADPTWVPDTGSFLRTGTDGGDAKAAAGRSDAAALAYFPSARSVVVDTTAVGTGGPVRLRWFDPTTGASSEIAASEAPQANRTVAYPGAHADGTTDWVLVVDRPASTPAAAPWAPLGGALDGGPGAASWGPGRLDAFARGTDGQLWHRWYDGGWYGWEPLGGALSAAPAAVSWSAGRLDVFVRGTDAQLWHRWYDGRWSAWEPLGGVLAGAPSVASWGPGRLDVVVTGPDGQAWHKWYSGRWSGWESLGGVLTAAPAAVSWSSGRLDVFARGADGRLWQRFYQGGWSAWTALGGLLAGAPAAASWAARRLDVVVVGTDRQVWHMWFDGSRWSPFEPLGGASDADPAAASWADGRLDVLVRGLDGQLWHKWYDGGRWF